MQEKMNCELEGFNYTTEVNKSVSTKKKCGSGFQMFDLSFPVLKGVLRKGYKNPTPIQRKSIPLILQGRDVVAMARTGSGKTACFLLPMFEKLMNSSPRIKLGARALILSPTRELALQTVKFIKELGKFTKFKVVAVLGGDSMDYQFGAMHNNPDIIVATPGRFLHLCIEMDLKLTSIEYVVFDEADRLFEMGFGNQLKEILDRLSVGRQTVLFSATLPKLLIDFAKAGLTNPVLLRLNVDSKLPEMLSLVYFSVKQDEKLASLLCLLNSIPKNSQTLIFVATKHHVEYLHKVLNNANISNSYIYSDLDSAARKINVGKFKNNICSVLIVTDVAARGIDIPQLDFVINYHFPGKSKLFVHRVGRCARAGKAGTAFSLVCSEEVPYVLDLHLFLGKKLNLFNNIRTKGECIDGAMGKIPEYLVESHQSDLIMWHQSNAEITAMEKVCNNGYRKYLRSRPGASIESVKRAKEMDLNSLEIHSFFQTHQEDIKLLPLEYVQHIKKYKPKGTIFELSLSNKSKCYSVMKKTKKYHEKYISSFKKKLDDANKYENTHSNLNSVKMKESDESDTGDTFNEVTVTKRKDKSKSEHTEKKVKFMNKEYYIPHFAPDEHTERGLSVNSFMNEANNVTLDITGDCEKELNMQTRIKKWDKKRKKMVGMVDPKIGKIKTESGNWISASYKSNRYAQWKEKTNTLDEENEENNLNEYKDYPNTHWGRHNRKLAEKEKARAGLKRPENIFKARKELEKKRLKSLPRSKRINFRQGKNQNKQRNKKIN